MAKISHLENTVCALVEGIREIKHLLLEKGKTPVSSSATVNDSGPSETSSRRLGDEVGRPSRVEPQPISSVQEHLPRHLELPIFEGNDPDGWIFRVERYFEINSLRADGKTASRVGLYGGRSHSMVQLGRRTSSVQWVGGV